MKLPLIKEPSGFVPIAMSLAALGLVLAHYAMYGIVRETDEGTPAHVFQLLMVAQVPVILFFAVKWLQRESSQALTVLALQFAAVVAAFASVYFLT
jgi:hypothetical protein